MYVGTVARSADGAGQKSVSHSSKTRVSWSNSRFWKNIRIPAVS